MVKHVTSFDVFDTLITRIVRSPRDVFLLIQKRLQNALSSEVGDIADTYWAERVWSEYTARRKSRADDITLEHIYRHMGRRRGLQEEQMQRMMTLEMQVEEDVLYPIEGSISLIRNARRHGEIVFISDTYFPMAFIRHLLRKFDLLQPADQLYVSGELGRSKRSGRLYLQVLANLKLPAANLLHCGDNLFSDVVMPRRLGIGIHPSVRVPHRMIAAFSVARERGKYACDLYRAQRMLRCNRGNKSE